MGFEYKNQEDDREQLDAQVAGLYQKYKDHWFSSLKAEGFIENEEEFERLTRVSDVFEKYPSVLDYMGSFDIAPPDLENAPIGFLDTSIDVCSTSEIEEEHIDVSGKAGDYPEFGEIRFIDARIKALIWEELGGERKEYLNEVENRLKYALAYYSLYNGVNLPDRWRIYLGKILETIGSSPAIITDPENDLTDLFVELKKSKVMRDLEKGGVDEQMADRISRLEGQRVGEKIDRVHARTEKQFLEVLEDFENPRDFFKALMNIE